MFAQVTKILLSEDRQINARGLYPVETNIINEFVFRANKRYCRNLAGVENTEYKFEEGILSYQGVQLNQQQKKLLMEGLIKPTHYIELAVDTIRLGDVEEYILPATIKFNTVKSRVSFLNRLYFIKLTVELIEDGIKIKKRTDAQTKKTVNYEEFCKIVQKLHPNQSVEYTGKLTKLTLLRYANQPEYHGSIKISEKKGALHICKASAADIEKYPNLINLLHGSDLNLQEIEQAEEESKLLFSLSKAKVSSGTQEHGIML